MRFTEVNVFKRSRKFMKYNCSELTKAIKTRSKKNPFLLGDS